MSISEHEEKMVNLQYQLRQNQSELQSYLADLGNWESEIKQKEDKLKTGTSEEKNGALPPVRNTIQKKKLKKKKKEKSANPVKSEKISGFDFRAWDKYDVDQALDEIDKDDKKAETSSSEYETDEEWELERKKHLANLEKEKGNTCFKSGDFDAAVEAYTKGMEFDATSSILPANRAMALLKQQKFAAAEIDCTMSISLDPLYIKAYLRRATARSALGKLHEAVEDYVRVLDLEPANKQAKMEKERLEKEMKREKEGPVKSSYTDTQAGIVKPVYKPPEERSKVPLKTIVIEEIGVETTTRPQPSLNQSDIARKVTSEEGEKFDKLFTSASSADSTETSSNPSNANSKKTNCIKATKEGSSESESRVDTANENLSYINGEEAFDPRNVEKKSSSRQQYVANTTVQHSSEKTERMKISSGDQVGESRDGKGATKSNKSVKQVTKVSSTDESGGGDSTFEVPQTSFQFQSDFKLLKKNPDLFFDYFQKIPPLQYVKLFGQSLDADILNAIIKSLSLNFDKCQDKLYGMLLNLSFVKRFSMTAMFLSSKDKQVTRELFEKLSSSGKCVEDELSSLKKKYDL